MADNVKVAVRCRPFNSTEKAANRQLCVSMQGTSTTIIDPSTRESKTFTFDYSYWSFDSSAPNFANQQTLFNDLGVFFLENAWEGYNSSIFAYGQTGAGKSFSMVGSPEEKGIIPLGCEELFRRIQSNTDPEQVFQVEVSFCEIYNEDVRDLFTGQAGLQIRESKATGIFVDGLKKIACSSYADVETAMDIGTKNRTIAATKMNATSSRAHSVFTIWFASGQKKPTKSAKVNLVDLAGSERQDKTGATGDRLKEATNINKSLTTLGLVIEALADISNGKSRFVPYRDSKLTRMLQESLGGNSKTIMVAAISPADYNYNESLSTLRYADRAKQIKNQAVVNMSESDKLIKELREEIEKYKEQLAGMTLPDYNYQLAQEEKEQMEREREALILERKALEEKIQSNEGLVTELNQTWEEKLKASRDFEAEVKSAMSDLGLSLSELKGIYDMDKDTATLYNLDQDSLLESCLVYFLTDDVITVGTSGTNIVLSGLGVMPNHCKILKKDGKYFIEPFEEAKTYVNGNIINSIAQLHHRDRIVFGVNCFFAFRDPVEAASLPTGQAKVLVTFEDAIRELAVSQGLTDKSREQELEQRLKEMEEKARLAEQQLQKQQTLFAENKQKWADIIASQEAAIKESEKEHQHLVTQLEESLTALRNKENEYTKLLNMSNYKQQELTAMIEEKAKKMEQTMLNYAAMNQEYEQKLAQVTQELNAAKTAKEEEIERILAAIQTYSSELTAAIQEKVALDVHRKHLLAACAGLEKHLNQISGQANSEEERQQSMKMLEVHKQSLQEIDKADASLEAVIKEKENAMKDLQSKEIAHNKQIHEIEDKMRSERILAMEHLKASEQQLADSQQHLDSSNAAQKAEREKAIASLKEELSSLEAQLRVEREKSAKLLEQQQEVHTQVQTVSIQKQQTLTELVKEPDHLIVAGSKVDPILVETRDAFTEAKNVMFHIQQANEIARSLNKRVEFSLDIQHRGRRHRIKVKITDIDGKGEEVMSVGEFMQRKAIMESGFNDDQDAIDPFEIDSGHDKDIGTGVFPTECLLSTDQGRYHVVQLTAEDGSIAGNLHVTVIRLTGNLQPKFVNGKKLRGSHGKGKKPEDNSIVNKSLNFELHIGDGTNFPPTIGNSVYLVIQIVGDLKYLTPTIAVTNNSATFKYKKVVSLGKVDAPLAEKIRTGHITLKLVSRTSSVHHAQDKYLKKIAQLERRIKRLKLMAENSPSTSSGGDIPAADDSSESDGEKTHRAKWEQELRKATQQLSELHAHNNALAARNAALEASLARAAVNKSAACTIL